MTTNESRGGELLKEMADTGERATPQTSLHHATRLADLGISRTQSHRWQRMAGVPEADFQGRLVAYLGPGSDGRGELRD